MRKLQATKFYIIELRIEDEAFVQTQTLNFIKKKIFAKVLGKICSDLIEPMLLNFLRLLITNVPALSNFCE
jgi:flagellar biosynthesis protein FliQ